MTFHIIYFLHIFFSTSFAHTPTDSELLEWHNARKDTAFTEINTLQSQIKGTRLVITGNKDRPLTFEQDWPFIERLLQFEPDSWDPHCEHNTEFLIPEKIEENPVLFYKITSIDASSCNITEQNISWFKRFPDVTNLNIDAHNRHSFSGKGILDLAKHLPKWVSIEAWDSPHFTVEGITEIAEAGFKRLLLTKNSLEDLHLQALIERHSKTEEVFELGLNANKFSEEWIKKLVKFNRLKGLAIGGPGNPIHPNTAISLLKGLPELTYFQLNNAKLTKDEWILLFQNLETEAEILPKNIYCIDLSKNILNAGFSKEELKKIYSSLMPILKSCLPTLQFLEILEVEDAINFYEECSKSGEESPIWLNMMAKRKHEYKQSKQKNKP